MTPPGGSKAATIRDVATRAGVSTATVSRAMRGGVGVDPTTRARVESAVRELHYRPSGVARSLKLRATLTIGLIVTDIENPFFPLVVRSVEDAARVHGYAVILADGRRDPDREIESLEVLAGRKVDGLLIASSAVTERHASWFADRPCPVVLINCVSPAVDAPAVLSDNRHGGRLAAGHLLELGHRQMAYVGIRESSNVASEERLAGVLEVVAASGAVVETVLGDGSVEAGAHAAVEVIERRPGTTAISCYNDLTAVGAMRGLRSLGLRVPADISVMGYDDIELAPFVDPALTTIRQRTDQMGRQAVEALIGQIDAGHEASAATDERDEPPGTPLRVPVELVVRDSTAACSPYLRRTTS